MNNDWTPIALIVVIFGALAAMVLVLLVGASQVTAQETREIHALRTQLVVTQRKLQRARIERSQVLAAELAVLSSRRCR